jgi:hypothetical protein
MIKYAEVRDGKVVGTILRDPDDDDLIRKINGEPVLRPVLRGEGHGRTTPSKAVTRRYEIFSDHVVEHLDHEELTANDIADALHRRVDEINPSIIAALFDFDRRLRLLEQKGRIGDAQFRAYLATLLIERTPSDELSGAAEEDGLRKL